jgi:hypothetical protein
MDGFRFDTLTRSLSIAGSRRRALLGLAAALGLSPLLAETKKRRKKKKKKCKGGTKKCGKKCIPASACCTDVACGTGGACVDGDCLCLNGFKTCDDACIPDEACCTDADCPNEGVCNSGTCVAPFCAGHNVCAMDEVQCQVEGASTQCFCVILEGSGDPFCGQAPTKRNTPCTSCTGEEQCINLTGCGDMPPTGCALPCPDPR